MARFLQILGVCVLLAAGGVFTLCILQLVKSDAENCAVLAAPDVVQTFMQNRGSHPQKGGEMVSPLVAQAQAFASYLNPAEPAKDTKAASPRFASRDSPSYTPAIRPDTPAMRFKLYGTSYYPNQPDKSMALIWEPAGAEGTTRWVKEGTQLGHFVVYQIRRGKVILRDGEQLREVAVEHDQAPKALVRNTRAGIGQVSAAVSGDRELVPAGPNDIEVGF